MTDSQRTDNITYNIFNKHTEEYKKREITIWHTPTLMNGMSLDRSILLQSTMVQMFLYNGDIYKAQTEFKEKLYNKKNEEYEYML